MYTNARKLKNIPQECPSWRPGGGEGERRGEGQGIGVCWWGWWWLKLDPDRGLLACVSPLHKHMLSFGDFFSDWLTGQVFFFPKHPLCDRALGYDYCQAPQQLPVAYFTTVQYIPKNTTPSTYIVLPPDQNYISCFLNMKASKREISLIKAIYSLVVTTKKAKRSDSMGNLIKVCVSWRLNKQSLWYLSF